MSSKDSFHFNFSHALVYCLNHNFRRMTDRHLGRNPFVCDCSLQWLSDYLEIHPIETSGARCENPRRLQKRKLNALRDERLKCKLFLISDS